MKSRVEHLDGFRGIAILSVFFYHAYYRWSDKFNSDFIFNDFSVFKIGYLGVNLFFMISGFVILMSLDKTDGVIEFLKKRWLRLFPCMLIVSVLLIVVHEIMPLVWLRSNLSISDALPGLFFISPDLINRFFDVKIRGLEGSFWSLYVEVGFYILSSILYFNVERKRFAIYIYAVSLILMFIFGITKILFPDSFLYLMSTSLGFKYYIWFSIGVFSYENYINNKRKVLDVKVLSLIIIALPFSKGDVVILVSMVLLILLFIFSFNVVVISKFLGNKYFKFFGFISYPLYLIHENSLISMMLTMEKYNFDDLYILICPLLAIFFMSFICFYMVKFIEPRLRSVLNEYI